MGISASDLMTTVDVVPLTKLCKVSELYIS